MSSAKPSLLLLHGALGNMQQFDALMPKLAPHFTLHRLNFSGHEGKSVPGEFDMDGFAREVESFLDEKGPCHIFGYSMGGYVALQLALQRPELMANILTLGTKFDWTPESAAKEVNMLNPDVIEAKVPAFAKMLQGRHGEVHWREVLEKTADMMIGLGNGNGLSEEDLKKVKTNVSVILGSKDRMVSQEESIWAAQVLPNATFHLIEGLPHPLEQADVEVLARQIIDLLGD